MCSELTVATAGDASAAKVDLFGRHDWRRVLRATLSHNGVEREVFGTREFRRGGGAFELTSRAVSGFSGSAEGKWTLCVTDTDAFGDSGVLERWSVHE